MNLNGKTYIVTGSSMGIGEAIARRIVDLNGRVLIHGLEDEATCAVATSLDMPFFIGDLASTQVCEGLVSKAIDEFGEIYGLINNAGAVLRNLIEETDADFWDRVMNVNARAPLLSLIHISEPTRPLYISYAVFCLKKKK